MQEKKSAYRMYNLMKYNELEAFAAQKKAGSRNAYFEQLDTFLQVAPPLLDTIALPHNDDELLEFLRAIKELQGMLIAIGSPSLIWGAEKIAEWARGGDRKRCGNALFVLLAKVRTLCSKLEKAKIDPHLEGTGKWVRDYARGEPESSGAMDAAHAVAAEHPKAPIKSEPFEKLCLLMDNFEMDDAMEMLQSLMGFTYNQEIDGVLASICGALQRFDHDGATALGRRLLDLTMRNPTDTAILGKQKILAIDDVPDILNTVKAILKNDFSVYGVTNHMAALKFLTTNSASLILLDIEMPDMNGFALLGIIRKIKAYENTPVLFLTGSVSVENIRNSQTAGANDFLRKPIDAQVLLGKVKKYLH